MTWRAVIAAILVAGVALPAGAAVWAGPVVDDATEQVDAAVDAPFRTAVQLLEPSDWHAGPAPARCDACRTIRIRGHRAPDVRYVLELLDVDGHVERQSTLTTGGAIAPFDVAQAMVLNCLFLVGQHAQAWPLAHVDKREARSLPWTVAVGPTASRSLDGQLAMAGSELAVGWQVTRRLALTALCGFEAFGRGSNALGRYQYRQAGAALLAGATWRTGDWRLGLSGGLRVADYEFEFQTSHLAESTDMSVFLLGEVKVERSARDVLRIGFAVRPQFALDATSIGPEGEADVYAEPRFAIQAALTVGVAL